jgi:hypothetical protein
MLLRQKINDLSLFFFKNLKLALKVGDLMLIILGGS